MSTRQVRVRPGGDGGGFWSRLAKAQRTKTEHIHSSSGQSLLCTYSAIKSTKATKPLRGLSASEELLPSQGDRVKTHSTRRFQAAAKAKKELEGGNRHYETDR